MEYKINTVYKVQIHPSQNFCETDNQKKETNIKQV